MLVHSARSSHIGNLLRVNGPTLSPHVADELGQIWHAVKGDSLEAGNGFALKQVFAGGNDQAMFELGHALNAMFALCRWFR